jgi:hypothetical protein
MRNILTEIETSNNQKKRSIMKKLAVCLSAFLLTFFLLSNAAYADDDDDVYPKKRLTITSAHVGPDNEIIYIHSKNFGNDPYVMLDEYELDIMGVTASTLIQAWLPAGLEPGTYRLLVAQRKPNGELNALKTDTMDLTIGVYTEIDPIFADSPASGIVEGDITDWNTAYGWGNHAAFEYLTGYTEADPTVAASVKDGVSWAEVTNKPTGFADGTDDVGILNESDPTVAASVKDGVSWTEVTNKPTGFADGTDDVGILNESDPQVGSNTTNYVPKWDGSALVKGTINDNNGNVGIGMMSPSERLVVGADFGVDYSGERIVIGGSAPETLTGLVIGEDSNNRGWMLWSVRNDIMVFGTKVGGTSKNSINVKLGNVGIGAWPDSNSRLKIKGSGNTNETSGLNVTNSDNKSSLFVRDDGNVGIGTKSPQSALQVDGYIQLALTSGAPPDADCNEESEEGRMKFNPILDVLYICSGESGWVSK